MLSADLLKFYTAYCNEEEVVCNIEEASKLSRRLGTLGYESKRTNSGKKFGVRVTQAAPDVKSTMLIGGIFSNWDKDDAPDSGVSKWCS